MTPEAHLCPKDDSVIASISLQCLYLAFPFRHWRPALLTDVQAKGNQEKHSRPRIIAVFISIGGGGGRSRAGLILIAECYDENGSVEVQVEYRCVYGVNSAINHFLAAILPL